MLAQEKRATPYAPFFEPQTCKKGTYCNMNSRTYKRLAVVAALVLLTSGVNWTIAVAVLSSDPEIRSEPHSFQDLVSLDLPSGFRFESSLNATLFRPGSTVPLNCTIIVPLVENAPDPIVRLTVVSETMVGRPFRSTVELNGKHDGGLIDYSIAIEDAFQSSISLQKRKSLAIGDHQVDIICQIGSGFVVHRHSVRVFQPK